ncbi:MULTISPECIES: iron ABC transporter permease [Sporomusa]|uniref:ABC transporter permease n=1 Tax=Sporomusa TaxID=2375 RepID=UPI0031589D11
MRYSGEKRFSMWTSFSLIILAIFSVFIIYPLALVLYKSVVDPHSGSFTLDYLLKFFTKKFYWSTLVNSFQVTVCSTLLAALIGLPMAYVMRSVKIKGSSWLDILIVISYLSPPFIGAYAWIQLLGRNGLVTNLINELFGITFDGIYGFAGIVLVFTLQSFPLVYMYVSGALKGLDNSLNEAAESLGCGRVERIMRIIVPLIMPTLLASSLLVFMRVFADFGTPMLIGEGFKTMPVLIYTQFMSEVGGDDGFAAALCVIIITLTILMFFAQRFLANRSTYSMTALKPMAAEQATGMKNMLSHAFVYLVVGLAILPQAVVIYTSFLKSNGGQVFTGGFGLQSYEATLFAKDNEVIWNTYMLGVISISIIVVLGILISYLTVRKRNVLNSTLDTITMFPYIIPGSVLGISFLFAFNNPPILLSGTALIMIIAFTIRRLPYTVRSGTAVIGQISPSVEEAAISLGASEMKTFTKVTVPMMMPGVLAGAIMSWVTIISELSSSIILYTNSTQTLTISIYTEVIRGNYGNASAYSTILTITSILSLLIFYRLTGRRDISM